MFGFSSTFFPRNPGIIRQNTRWIIKLRFWTDSLRERFSVFNGALSFAKNWILLLIFIECLRQNGVEDKMLRSTTTTKAACRQAKKYRILKSLPSFPECHSWVTRSGSVSSDTSHFWMRVTSLHGITRLGVFCVSKCGPGPLCFHNAFCETCVAIYSQCSTFSANSYKLRTRNTTSFRNGDLNLKVENARKFDSIRIQSNGLWSCSETATCRVT